MMKKLSKKQLRLFFLPAIAIAIVLTGLFVYRLFAPAKTNTAATAALNTALPDATLDTTARDKFAIYQLADQDSVKLAELRRADPAYLATKDGIVESPFTDATNFSNNGSNLDKSTTRLEQRLSELQQHLNEQPSQPVKETLPVATPTPTSSDMIEQLSKMMIEKNSSTENAELDQLNNMLNKVYDIQHPEQVKERWKSESRDGKKIIPVATQLKDDVTDLLNKDSALNRAVPARQSISFYDDEETPVTSNAIQAVVHRQQVLTDNQTIKFRTQQDIYVSGVKIPAGSFIDGKCSLSDDRLNVQITAIAYRGNIYPVELTVFANDGIPGIPVKNAITQQSRQQGADQALQALQLSSIDPSIGAQAASAGIEAMKGLMSKKNKLITVTVRADCPVLLVPKNN